MKINLPPNPDDLTPEPPGDPNAECKKSPSGEHLWQTVASIDVPPVNNPPTEVCVVCGASR